MLVRIGKLALHEKPVTYSITIGDNEPVTFKEGEVVSIPLEHINNPTTRQIFVGEAGRLNIYGKGKYVYYDIDMAKPATHFIGSMHIMDLTSGLSGGSEAVEGFSGRVATSGYTNHMYSASLVGIAYFAGAPVAKVTDN